MACWDERLRTACVLQIHTQTIMDPWVGSFLTSLALRPCDAMAGVLNWELGNERGKWDGDGN